MLKEAAGSIADHAEDAQASKQHDEAVKLWSTLINAMAIRKRLADEYGS